MDKSPFAEREFWTFGFVLFVPKPCAELVEVSVWERNEPET